MSRGFILTARVYVSFFKTLIWTTPYKAESQQINIRHDNEYNAGMSNFWTVENTDIWNGDLTATVTC